MCICMYIHIYTCVSLHVVLQDMLDPIRKSLGQDHANCSPWTPWTSQGHGSKPLKGGQAL